MKKKPTMSFLRYAALMVFGNAIFALGFDLFLVPQALNIGGLSGLAMIVQHLIGRGGIGFYTAVMNVPLFLLGYHYIGKSFFYGSLLGTVLSSAFIDLFAVLPAVELDPVLSVVFGGAVSGVGLGMIFLTGASTGGTDILVRLLKKKFRVQKLGAMTLAVDVVVLAMTGFVFGDITKALYGAMALFICTKVIDGVLYGLDNSCVALIITEHHNEVYQAIDSQLDRGATFLSGVGGYTKLPRTVLMTAIKSRQVSELKLLVQCIDPEAFMIVQPAHQVLGLGFKGYTDDI